MERETEGNRGRTRKMTSRLCSVKGEITRLWSFFSSHDRFHRSNRWIYEPIFNMKYRHQESILLMFTLPLSPLFLHTSTLNQKPPWELVWVCPGKISRAFKSITIKMGEREVGKIGMGVVSRLVTLGTAVIQLVAGFSQSLIWGQKWRNNCETVPSVHHHLYQGTPRIQKMHTNKYLTWLNYILTRVEKIIKK